MAEAINWVATLAKHRSWLETVVRSRLVDRHASDDVMQEVAVAVLNQNNRPTDEDHVAPWLYRIAVRKVINYRRSAGRQRNLIERYVARQPSSDEEMGSESGGLKWLLEKEQHVALCAAIQELGQSDREMLLLKYNHQWSYAQLADHLGVTIKTIEYRLVRARQALRESMERRLGVEK